MNQPQSLNTILNSLFSNAALTQDLSSEEQEAMKTLVGELMDGISQLTIPVSPRRSDAPSIAHSETDRSVATDIDALISELGIEVDESVPQDNLVDALLSQHSDTTLINLLDDHVDAASDVVEILGQRPIGKQELDTIRRVELQLVAVSLYVSDLRQALEQQVKGKRLSHHPHWLNYIKSLLLHEFDFINNWLR
ncbi:MAG: hypothetical protein NW224_30140 [Leptolyngbyaceae cyanobacterium bins.302]|nr:hypothetical protein [Leptolyngbyaceae cyanobacterium bins.302]